MDFEQSMQALESIVERLEGGELSLEEALLQYEQGVALTRACQQALDAAEQKVRLLAAAADGSETLVPFAPAEPAPPRG